MSLNIITNNENVLLGRKEIVAEVDFKGATPSKADITKMTASKVGVDEKLVVIKVVKNKYGEQKADVTAYVYSDLENMKKIEMIKEDKKEAEGSEAAEAKPVEGAEKPAEEAKPEEKKEGEQ